MEYAYRFRIYPIKEQIDKIQRTFGCCRFVYNHYLAERSSRYNEFKETMNYNACSNDMTQLKRRSLGSLKRTLQHCNPRSGILTMRTKTFSVM